MAVCVDGKRDGGLRTCVLFQQKWILPHVEVADVEMTSLAAARSWDTTVLPGGVSVPQSSGARPEQELLISNSRVG